MATYKKTFVCVECGKKTSTTEPKRGEVRVCRDCLPEVQTTKPAARVELLPAGSAKTPKAAKQAKSGKADKPARSPKAVPAQRPAATAKPATAGKPADAPKPATVERPAKAAKMAEAAKPDAGERKVGGLTAAANLLRETGEEWNAMRLWHELRDRGLWASDGKTPEATLSTAIRREMRDKRKESRFARGGERGTFRANASA